MRSTSSSRSWLKTAPFPPKILATTEAILFVPFDFLFNVIRGTEKSLLAVLNGFYTSKHSFLRLVLASAFTLMTYQLNILFNNYALTNPKKLNQSFQSHSWDKMIICTKRDYFASNTEFQDKNITSIYSVLYSNMA